MKATRVSVFEYAKKHGYEPIQIDGIPEGFSWKEPDIQIGDVFVKGREVVFEPLEELKPIFKEND